MFAKPYSIIPFQGRDLFLFRGHLQIAFDKLLAIS